MGDGFLTPSNFKVDNFFRGATRIFDWNFVFWPLQTPSATSVFWTELETHSTRRKKKERKRNRRSVMYVTKFRDRWKDFSFSHLPLLVTDVPHCHTGTISKQWSHLLLEDIVKVIMILMMILFTIFGKWISEVRKLTSTCRVSKTGVSIGHIQPSPQSLNYIDIQISVLGSKKISVLSTATSVVAFITTLIWHNVQTYHLSDEFNVVKSISTFINDADNSR